MPRSRRVAPRARMAAVLLALVTACGDVGPAAPDGTPDVPADAAPTEAAPAWLDGEDGLLVVDGVLVVAARGTSLANVDGAARAQSTSVARGELPDPLSRVLTGAARHALAPRRAALDLDDGALDAALARQLVPHLAALGAAADVTRQHRLANGRVVTLALVPVVDLADPLAAALQGLVAELAAADQLDGDPQALGATTAEAARAVLSTADRAALDGLLERSLGEPWPPGDGDH